MSQPIRKVSSIFDSMLENKHADDVFVIMLYHSQDDLVEQLDWLEQAEFQID